MPKTDGDITKERILQVAEKLFSEDGFDGTGVDKIAKNAGINKGSIYYHFKDKNDIMESLFKKIIDDMSKYVDSVSDLTGKSLEDKIKSEIQYLSDKKRILAILFMETLKSGNNTDYFIRCLEIIIKNELDSTVKKEELSDEELQKYIVYEFFTGMMPIISFITLKDKWCEYFKYDERKFFEYFMEAFVNTHIKSHKFKE
ncbi:TetR/AcrR family transcriptional regulator [Clostridium hydrogenum]|uniref:TetR/AcrR family transcriptional regulator n=1 Tax=Clostridium hydrogenum TaxID=2855764 RepID=UPI001F228184|nr:TetR/AcrR family transcriptional regulator [Clostridium hydrogenum]